MLISAISSNAANAYVTVADADNYFSQRKNKEWAELSVADKEGAIISATDYIEATYYSSFIGEKSTRDQALAWPRVGVVVDRFLVSEKTIPNQIKKASYEMALRASRGELIEDQGQRVVSEKVDVLTVKYYEHSDGVTRYPFVSRILSPLLCSSYGSGYQTAELKRT